MIILDEIDSTNSYAKRLLERQTIEDSLSILARYQNAGRGQQRKVWHSQKGENILMTLVIKPTTWGYYSLQDAFLLSSAVANSLCSFLSFCGIPENTLFVKWPNDIYVDKSKIAGILLENISKGDAWKWALIGLGINVNQLDFSSIEGRRTTSLGKNTHRLYDVPLLARQLKDWLVERIFYKKDILKSYAEKLFTNQCEWVKAVVQGKMHYVRIVKIHTDGHINLCTKDGVELLRIAQHEIVWHNL